MGWVHILLPLQTGEPNYQDVWVDATEAERRTLDDEVAPTKNDTYSLYWAGFTQKTPLDTQHILSSSAWSLLDAFRIVLWKCFLKFHHLQTWKGKSRCLWKPVDLRFFLPSNIGNFELSSYIVQKVHFWVTWLARNHPGLGVGSDGLGPRVDRCKSPRGPVRSLEEQGSWKRLRKPLSTIHDFTYIEYDMYMETKSSICESVWSIYVHREISCRLHQIPWIKKSENAKHIQTSKSFRACKHAHIYRTVYIHGHQGASISDSLKHTFEVSACVRPPSPNLWWVDLFGTMASKPATWLKIAGKERVWNLQ